MTSRAAVRAALPAGNAAAPLVRLLLLVRAAYGVHRQRQALGRLTDRQLADVGLSRGAAEAEAARAFWDIPSNQRF